MAIFNDLYPVNGQKSFYSKAKVEVTPYGAINLWSYATCVAFIYKGEFYRVWNGYSATTAKHINAFRNVYGSGESKRAISKSQWLSLPLSYDYIGGDGNVHIATR